MLGASSIAPLSLMHSACTPRAREMAARDLGIFGRDAHMAPARRIVALRILLRRRDDEAAAADIQIERHIDFGIVEFHQHVVAGDAELRRAESDEGRDVEAAHADDVEPGVVGLEAELARSTDRRTPARSRCRRASAAASPPRGCGPEAAPEPAFRYRARTQTCSLEKPAGKKPRRSACIRDRMLWPPTRRPGLAEII